MLNPSYFLLTNKLSVYNLFVYNIVNSFLKLDRKKTKDLRHVLYHATGKMLNWQFKELFHNHWFVIWKNATQESCLHVMR